MATVLGHGLTDLHTGVSGCKASNMAMARCAFPMVVAILVNSEKVPKTALAPLLLGEVVQVVAMMANIASTTAVAMES